MLGPGDAAYFDSNEPHTIENVDDTEYQAGIEGLEYAARKGMGIIIMEPLRGGRLSRRLPEEIVDLITTADPTITPTAFALRFLFNRPEINCVLSGMTTIEQLEENIKIAGADQVNTLSVKDLLIYEKARKIYRSRIKVNCTGCEYCLPCPQKIPIPFLLELYNNIFVYNALDDSKWVYKVFVKRESRANNCAGCRECDEKCPQKIPVSSIVGDIDRQLGEGK